MMTNLFSTFDPSTSMFYSLNWMSTFIILMLLPYPFWLIKSRHSMMIYMTMMSLHNEFKNLLVKNNGLSLMMLSTFMFIIINNMMGLLPYIFTSSSHLVFSLALSLPMWLSMMLFGWINKTQSMFSHLIPDGTPGILMPFMVCIETISNLIRPGSLAVRLTANIMAMLSAMTGAIGGLNQTFIKKIMAFSSVNHMGWMIICMKLDNEMWIKYWIIYSTIIYMLVKYMEKNSMTMLNQLNLNLKNKMDKMNMIFLFLSLGGLPPFIGFLPKWIVIQSMINYNMNIELMILMFSSMSAMVCV